MAVLEFARMVALGVAAGVLIAFRIDTSLRSSRSAGGDGPEVTRELRRGNVVDDRLSDTLKANDNGHDSRSVNMGPVGQNVDEVEICAEIGRNDDGHYDTIACTTRFLS